MNQLWISERPQKAFLYPTIACNLDCQMCYSRNSITKSAPQKNISFEKLKDMIVQLYQSGVRIFDLSGGEPFLHQDLFKVFRFIKQWSDTTLLVVSNGTLIERAMKRGNSDDLQLIDQLFISLDSVNPHVHNSIRKNPMAFEKAMEGIMLLQSFNFHRLGLNFVVMKENFQEVDQLIDLALEKKIQRIQFLRAIDVSADPEGRQGQLTENLYSEVYDKILQKIWSLNQSLDDFDLEILLVLPGYQLYPYQKQKKIWKDRLPTNKDKIRLKVDFDPIKSCPAFGNSVVVTYEGEVTGCTAMVNIDEFSIGNINGQKYDQLLGNWSHYQNKIKQREAFLKTQGPCLDCGFWKSCKGGCPAVAHKYFGDMMQPDPTCSVLVNRPLKDIRIGKGSK